MSNSKDSKKNTANKASAKRGQPAGQINRLAVDNTYNIEIDYKSIGSRLREERKKLHYTQEQVAEAIDITPAFVGHIERNERSMSLDTLIKICKLYGVTIDYILSDTLPVDSDNVLEQIRGMLKDKTEEQKAAVLDILSTIIRHI